MLMVKERDMDLFKGNRLFISLRYFASNVSIAHCVTDWFCMCKLPLELSSSIAHIVFRQIYAVYVFLVRFVANHFWFLEIAGSFTITYSNKMRYAKSQLRVM